MDRVSWYVLRRLLVLVVGVLVILTVEFTILRVVPGDPLRWALPGSSDYGEWGEHVVDMFEQPLYVQYFEFIGDMLSGDFGYSHVFHADIDERIYSAMWRTLTLFGASLSLCLVIGSLGGRLISKVRSHLSRQALSITSLALFSFIVVGWQWVFLRYFSIEWGLLPLGGGVELENAILPIASISLASVGAFILFVRDGQTRASAALSHDDASFRDGLFAALPNIQFMIAGVMLFVVASEVIFVYPGVGFFFISALFNMDYFLLQATFFLLVMMVFAANYAIETVVTLTRPKRRLDMYLREGDSMPGGVAATPTQADSSPLSVSRIWSALGCVLKDYLRSPVGLMSLAVFMAIVVLAIVGPSLTSDELTPWIEPSPTDLFLDGATALMAVSLIVGLLSSFIGMALGVATGLIRPYADGIVVAVMQGLIAMPMTCLLLMRVARPWPDFGYLDASLIFCIPVIALVTLLVCHGYVSSRRRVVAAVERPSDRVRFIRSIPAVVSWTLGGLKYGMPMTVIGVFVCDFWGLTPFDSWGRSFDLSLRYSMQATNELSYILPPLLGTALLIGSTFLVLDTLERVIRARFSGLV